MRILENISSDFCVGFSASKEPNVIIRADKLSVHLKTANIPKLKALELKFAFHNSQSKNHTSNPELDGRIAKLSRILNLLIQNPDTNQF